MDFIYDCVLEKISEVEIIVLIVHKALLNYSKRETELTHDL